MLVSRKHLRDGKSNTIFISAITYRLGSVIEGNKAYFVQEIYKMMLDIQLQHACMHAHNTKILSITCKVVYVVGK